MIRRGMTSKAGVRPVVVVTELDDPTADMVIEELNRRQVPVVRFDPAEFPRDLVLAARFDQSGMRGELRTRSRALDLTAVRSLYYRRPQRFDFSHLDKQDARFASAQARYGLGGTLTSLPGCRYVNHPHAIADAEYKPAQLTVAADIGMTIPATIITNDPAEAHQFAAEHAPIIYKPLYSTPYQDNQPDQITGTARTIWVRHVNVDELSDAVTGTAHLFQARVDKQADLRVTVVGDAVFCVRIDATDPDLLDWRYDYDKLTYTVIEPRAGLTDECHAYLKRFGLVFGCFDFALTRSDDPVFLECNPNGQWAWMEGPTGLPMTAAFADLLERGNQ
jgi:ATP-grasp ribosomal peptide maturase